MNGDYFLYYIPALLYFYSVVRVSAQLQPQMGYGAGQYPQFQQGSFAYNPPQSMAMVKIRPFTSFIEVSVFRTAFHVRRRSSTAVVQREHSRQPSS